MHLLQRKCLVMFDTTARGGSVGKNMHGLIHHTKKDGNTFPEKECRIIASKRGKAFMSMTKSIGGRTARALTSGIRHSCSTGTEFCSVR